MKLYQLILFLCVFDCPLNALEVNELQGKIAMFDSPPRLLRVINGLGFIEKPEWSEAEVVISNTSGDLGVRSISLKIGSRGGVKSVVLMGKSPDSYQENPDIIITSISIVTGDETFTYSFDLVKNAFLLQTRTAR